MKELVSIKAPAKRKSPALVYLGGLLPTGRRSMKGKLQKVADILGNELNISLSVESLPWHEIRYEHLETIRAKLLKLKVIKNGKESGLAPATINGCLYAVRGVAKAAFNLELMPADAYERIRNVKPVKGERLSPGRALSIGEIGALLNTCTEKVIGTRDASIIAVMYMAGLRRAEIVALDTTDFNDGELKVLGKGNKQRLLYINNGAYDALNDWLSIRGDAPGALFNPVTRAKKIQQRRMTEQAIYNLLLSRAEKAKINRFSPHDLRRSFISDLLDKGADISVVSSLAGHANIQTTAKYDRRGEEAKKKATGLLHVPYKKMKQE